MKKLIGLFLVGVVLIGLCGAGYADNTAYVTITNSGRPINGIIGAYLLSSNGSVYASASAMTNAKSYTLVLNPNFVKPVSLTGTIKVKAVLWRGNQYWIKYGTVTYTKIIMRDGVPCITYVSRPSCTINFDS